MSVTNDGVQLMTFQLGYQRYGIHVTDVREVIRAEPTRAVPDAPSFVSGVISLRELILPVLDLHVRFDLERLSPGEEGELSEEAIVVVEIETLVAGVRVDRALQVSTVPRDDIKPPPITLSGIGSEYIEAVVDDEGGDLLILDIRRLMSASDVAALEDATRGAAAAMVPTATLAIDEDSPDRQR